jgi:hypothetical protein
MGRKQCDHVAFCEWQEASQRPVELENPAQTGRKPGRPLTNASWFPAVAETIADGTTLRTALAIHGLSLSANEMRGFTGTRHSKGFI